MSYFSESLFGLGLLFVCLHFTPLAVAQDPDPSVPPPLTVPQENITEESLPAEGRPAPESLPAAEPEPLPNEELPEVVQEPDSAPPPPPISTDRLAEISRLRTILRVEPDEETARLQLADLLYAVGDSDAAIDEYRTLLRFRPETAAGHLGLGIALMAKQDWRTALAELQEALRLDPSLVQAHFSMGTIHYTRGSPLAAAKAYREALRLKPDFAEAHNRLGLVLKTAGQDKEAAQELEMAALSGIAKAQLFLGNAYKAGQGVEKSQVLAVTWWFRAFEQGLPDAAQALAQLRRLATARNGTPTKQAKAAIDAFHEFCEQLWLDFPDLDREEPDDTVGVALMKHGRIGEALPVLLREAYALNERAHAELVRLYEEGLDGQLPKHGQWILSYLESTAADGARASRAALARIYGRGLGVTQDMAKARGYLKGFSKDEAKALLEGIAAAAPPS
jgi:tetratricopeptide (TPR) repeat protein